jgi:peptide chain release factor subunit 3
VCGLLDGKGKPVKYAAPGENIQIKINVADEEGIKRGDVLCNRDSMMPVTDIFEAEVDLLELLDYKPILSKGYNCIMHIHTYNDEVTIKDIMRSEEIIEKGDNIIKTKPQFARSHNKIICRIVPRMPLALEKFDTIAQMGRFTLRDEGKTIAVGKVLKYKPYSKGIVGASGKPASGAQKVTQQLANASISENKSGPDMVFDMETGEMHPKKKDMDAIAEGDEDNE